MKNNAFKPWIKENRRKKAEDHTAVMDAQFSDYAEYSIQNSVVYRDKVDIDVPENTDTINLNTEFIVEGMTTEDAIKKYKELDICVLNFASFKYPGGGFIIGAIAQEEALCHASNLFNVLGSTVFDSEYAKNRNDKCSSLYKNFAIYSPHIIFPDDNVIISADVLTCPAPNLANYTGDIEKAHEALASRIHFLLDVAKKHNVKNIILGAFGCGVFKNDPTLVANLFKKYITNKKYDFDKVIFAIPSGPNLDAFKNVFDSKTILSNLKNVSL